MAGVITYYCSECDKWRGYRHFYHRQSGPHQGKPLGWCKDCRAAYRRAYTLPCLRGRGKAHVLPEWVGNYLRQHNQPLVFTKKIDLVDGNPTLVFTTDFTVVPSKK